MEAVLALQEKCKGSVQSKEAVPPGGWWPGLPVPGLPCTSCISVPWSGTPHGKELRDTATEGWRLAPSHRPPISGAAPQLPAARVRFFNSCLCPSTHDLHEGPPRAHWTLSPPPARGTLHSLVENWECAGGPGVRSGHSSVWSFSLSQPLPSTPLPIQCCQFITPQRPAGVFQK